MPAMPRKFSTGDSVASTPAISRKIMNVRFEELAKFTDSNSDDAVRATIEFSRCRHVPRPALSVKGVPPPGGSKLV